MGGCVGVESRLPEILGWSFCSSSSRSLAKKVVRMDLCASSTKPTASDRLLYSDLVTLSENRSINKRASISAGNLQLASLVLVVMSDQS